MLVGGNQSVSAEAEAMGTSELILGILTDAGATDKVVLTSALADANLNCNHVKLHPPYL